MDTIESTPIESTEETLQNTNDEAAGIESEKPIQPEEKSKEEATRVQEEENEKDAGEKEDIEDLFGGESEEEEETGDKKEDDEEKGEKETVEKSKATEQTEDQAPVEADSKPADEEEMDDLFGGDSEDEDVVAKATPEALKSQVDDAKKQKGVSKSLSSSSDSDSSEDETKESGKKKRLRKGAKKPEEIAATTVAKEAEDPSALAEKRTEKDDFIDSDDDNPDLLQSYKEQKAYDSDDDPYRDDQRLNAGEEGDGGLLGKEPGEEDRGFDNVLKKLKARGRKRGDGMTEDEREDFVHSLLVRMDKAYDDDLDCRRQRKPGLSKLKMLSEVLAALRKTSFQTIFLERNLLQVLGQWLRPSVVDGSLPDMTIRNKIYDALFKLPIESDHLRRAGFGKVISYLKDCKKETDFNRAKLRKLIQNWARMIFGKTDNFKMLEQMQHISAEMQLDQTRRRPKKRKERDSTGPKGDVLHSLATAKEAGSASTGKKALYRARVPQPRDFQFRRRVTENSEFGASDTIQSPNKTSKHRNLEKRLKSKKLKR